MKDLLRCLAFASLLLPVAVLGNVVFPTNPQTRAECDGPATQLRAMSQAEHDKAVALMREENKIHLTMECASDRRCEANYYAQHHDYYLRISAHFRERDRLSNLRYKLETQCRRIARANEKVTEATIQAEQERQRSMMQRARDAYHKMKQNYERVKALGKNLTESDKLSMQADMQEADRSMADLNDTMDDAKRLILDPVPNHPIVRGFQDSAYKKFKQQMFNTRRAVNQYEQMMEAFQPESEPTQEAQEDDSPFMRRSGGSATSMFRGDPDGKEAAANAEEKRRVVASLANQKHMMEESADMLRKAAPDSSDARSAANALEVVTGKVSPASVRTSMNGGGGGGGSGVGYTPHPAKHGLNINECGKELALSNIEQKLDQLPDTETVTQLRGTIAVMKFQIDVFAQCLPDPEAKKTIDSWMETLISSQKACAGVASDPGSCNRAPF